MLASTKMTGDCETKCSFRKTKYKTRTSEYSFEILFYPFNMME